MSAVPIPVRPVGPARMTAEEFLAKYGDCSGVELVRGQVVMPGEPQPRLTEGGHVPHFKHGVVCHNADALIGGYIRANDLGWVAINDTFIPLGPDVTSSRGADLLFISYSRLPKGPAPERLTLSPDLVVEVRSPSDRNAEVLTKVAEYLDAGVNTVLVLDPSHQAVLLYVGDEMPRILRADDELTLPGTLPGFRVRVGDFFA